MSQIGTSFKASEVACPRKSQKSLECQVEKAHFRDILSSNLLLMRSSSTWNFSWVHYSWRIKRNGPSFLFTDLVLERDIPAPVFHFLISIERKFIGHENALKHWKFVVFRSNPISLGTKTKIKSILEQKQKTKRIQSRWVFRWKSDS